MGLYPKILLHRIPASTLPERLGIMVAKLRGFLGGEILFLVRMQVFFHLPDDMFGFMEILDIQVRRCPCNFMRMAALRAELPFLETVHVRERAARRAPDDEVHDSLVMSSVVLKIYRPTIGDLKDFP